MLLNLLMSALVYGNSTCPSPAQVDAFLSPEVARRVTVSLTPQPEGVQLELRDVTGALLGVRVLRASSDCVAVAFEAARVIRGIERRVPLAAPVRLEAAEPTPWAPPLQALELIVELGAVMAPGPRGFSGRAWVVGAAQGTLTLAAALEVLGPVGVSGGSTLWQLSFDPAMGLRHALGAVTLDAFVATPLSLIAGGQPCAMLSGLAGLRVTLGAERLAPVLQIALAVPLVKPVSLELPPVALTVSLGMRGGVW